MTVQITSNASKNPLAYTLLIFIASRVIAYKLGVIFDYTLLDYGWQYLDPIVLSKSVSSLAQNLLYMNGQPPLFNLFLGIILLIFQSHASQAFTIIYFIFGLIYSSSICLLMSRLKVDWRVNVIMTSIFIISPACILIESCLFYAYPIVTCLTVSALCFYEFLENGRFRYAFIGSSCLAAMALMWSLFHLIWMIFVMIPIFGVLYYKRDFKKLQKLGIAYILPLLLVISVYAKNAILFGSFSPSSWFGMSLAKIVYSRMPSEERKHLVESGEISELSLLDPWLAPSKYPAHYFNFKKTGVPALDALRKSVEPATFYNVNYHNLGYNALSKDYLKDAMQVITHHPKYYLEGVASAYLYYHMPTTSWPVFDYGYSQPSRTAISELVNFYNVFFYGCFVHVNPSSQGVPDKDQITYYGVSYSLLVALPILLIYGFYLAVKNFREQSLEYSALISFFCLNILFVGVFCNLIEIGESQRYRFSVDAFYLILGGLMISDIVTRFSNRKHDTK
ncbi:MAG: hypothetical protein H7Y37_16600 [Anaerolineae bacterium]|nr:hypothetical protein [Gloeobacterales cyanobacterium ES-bin-313]